MSRLYRFLVFCQLCHPIYKLIGESADRNVTIFVRTNYNSLKEAWQSWQKFGERTRFGDCKPLIVIYLRRFLISGRWCGTKLVPIYRRSISSGDSPVMSAMSCNVLSGESLCLHPDCILPALFLPSCFQAFRSAFRYAFRSAFCSAFRSAFRTFRIDIVSQDHNIIQMAIRSKDFILYSTG